MGTEQGMSLIVRKDNVDTFHGMLSDPALGAQHAMHPAPCKLTKLPQWSGGCCDRSPKVDCKYRALVNLQAGIEAPSFVGTQANVEGGAERGRRSQRPPRCLSVNNASNCVVRAQHPWVGERAKEQQRCEGRVETVCN
jgi:hypothetical protein